MTKMAKRRAELQREHQQEEEDVLSQHPSLAGPAAPSATPRVTVSETGGRDQSVRRLNREKSFEEARSAVQSQIEKIFRKAAAAEQQQQALAHRQLPQHPHGTKRGLLGGIQTSGADVAAAAASASAAAAVVSARRYTSQVELPSAVALQVS